ncbi:MAG: SUMF1/EgtB/PvdO family nonheme iron enzyme [Bryobacterales bacterium]
MNAFRVLIGLALATTLTAAENAAPKAPMGMALIPAGEFSMGRHRLTADDEKGMRPLALRDDRPVHTVLIDAFYMDVDEVTHAKYAAFVEATHHTPPYHWLGGKMPEEKKDLPVYNVDWQDASDYCAWAGKRLPTEAEWEKAARGGLEGLDYPWGDDKPTTSVALFNTPLGPSAVGKRKPNAYGLRDMAGGVAEWCSDWFERTYYEASPAANPKGPETGMYKVIRGGSWSSGPRRITVFFRNWVRPNQKTPNLGFRCVQDAQ